MSALGLETASLFVRQTTCHSRMSKPYDGLV